MHVPGLGSDSLQGDAVLAGLLGDMGCDVHVDERGTTVSRHGPLRGIDVDMADISDLVDGTLPQQRLLSNAPCELSRPTLTALFEGALHYW